VSLIDFADGNAGACTVAGAFGRAVKASDRHASHWRRGRMAPLRSPSSHRRIDARPLRQRRRVTGHHGLRI